VSLGGPVLKTPKVQLIRYESDPHSSDLDAFLQELTTTPYWAETTSEYGVGPLTVLPSIARSDVAPANLSDTALQSELAANLSGANPVWGPADSSAIYLYVLPPGTIIDAFGKCCQDFDGYHDEATVGAGSVAYAVVCSCGGAFDGPGITDVQQVTVAMSHELVEAATDPFIQSAPAFGQNDKADIVWTLATGGEVADMCEFNTNAFIVPQGSKYMVQQSYSDAAAKAGKDPCLPAANADPYFGAAAIMPDMLKIKGIPFMTPGVKLAVGMTKTIDVQLFSEAPTKGPFTVTPYDFSSFFGGAPNLELTLDKTSGQNGDVLKLTIKVLKIDPSLGADAFFLETDLGKDSNLLAGIVGL
jgi:hypothetical protein